jgi:hypothetical protein
MLNNNTDLGLVHIFAYHKTITSMVDEINNVVRHEKETDLYNL